MTAARRSVAALLSFLALGAAASAQQPLADAVYNDLNDAVIRHQIAAGSAEFAAAANDLVEAISAYCATGADADLATAHTVFHAAYDRWMAIGWVNFGPQTLLMRSVRVHFWPDSRNALGRQLAGVLTSPRPDLLEPPVLGRASVALQGLPALERLLFEATPVADDAYACDLAVAVAGNVQGIAADLSASWADDDQLASVLPAGAALAANLFQSIHDQLELIVARKVAPVLGETAADARPRLAENWRSGRAMRNIAVNLAAVLGVVQNGDATGFADVLRESAGRPDAAAAVSDALEEAVASAPIVDGCGIAADGRAGGFLLSNGLGSVWRYNPADGMLRQLSASQAPVAHWDNHLTAI